MEIRSNNKAKHRSQRLAFGIFRLLSLCIVLILFAILGFIIYKGAGAISWEFITSAPTDGMTGGAQKTHVPQIRYRHHIHSRGPQTPELP